ncbi:MAG TPA: hypothetical protein VJ870_16555 [Amycolatopsis sp.]|nr:hypothetical protein [Amycolatopsis sp.]
MGNPFYHQNEIQAMFAKDAAGKMFSPDDTKSMRAMLDDPYVSHQNKQNILYALSDMQALTPDEIGSYCGKLQVPLYDVANGGQAPMENLVNAKASLELGREEQRTGPEKKALDDSQKRLDEGNFKNSDEIIDQADVALKVFDDFYPRYTKAGGQSTMGGGADAPGAGLDPQSLRAATKQFRGIDFGAFKTDADALTAASKSANDANQQLATAWANNMADWKGSGATAAAQHKSKLDAGAATLIQSLANAPGTVTQGIGTVDKQVTDFAKQVHNVYGDGKMAQLTPADVDALLQSKEQLPGVIQQLQQKIQELNNRSTFDKIVGGVLGIIAFPFVGPVTAILGVSLAHEITEDNIGEETQKYQQALADAQTKLQQFTQDYATKANSVQQQASNTLQGVQQSYDAMLQGLGQGMDKDPFADVTAPSQSSGSDSSSSSSSGGGGGNNSAAGGGGVGAGGGGGATAPESTTPSDPAQVAKAAQQEAAQGTNPITGKPMEIDPSTGQPYPIDPKTGEAIKDTGEDQDTVTVKKGDNTIEMSEPDKDGKMDVKVDDGAGHAKDYKLDWGDDKAKADGTGTGGANDPATGAGAAGAAAGDAGAAGDKVYTPGPDGKIHIDDGNLKITAERPEGPDGPTVVTVDDGSGTPTTYTLGEEHKGVAGVAGSASDTGASAAGQGGSAAGAAQSGDASAAAGSAAGADGTSGGGFPAPSGVDGAAGGGGGVDGAAAASGGGGDAGVAGGDGAAAPDPQQTKPAGAGADAIEAGAAAGSVSGSLGDPGALGADPGAHLGDASSLGQGAHTGSVPGQPGLGVAPAGPGDPAAAAAQAQPAAAGGSGMGSLGSMGGMMGGMGGGGDQERSSSAYRIDGGIFNTSGSGGRISGSLDDGDSDRSVRLER